MDFALPNTSQFPGQPQAAESTGIYFTAEELSEDPRDLIANYLLHSAERLSVSALHFTAFYLLSHGAIKAWLIIGLLREKLSYYPVAIAVFALFIAYQLYRVSFTHSI